MYEVEVKVPADHGAVRERLAELGAEHVGAVEQVDTYYDAPHRSFAETDEAVRLRMETPAGAEGVGEAADVDGGDQAAGTGGDDTAGEPVHEFAYKGPKVDAGSKTRQEHGTTLGDPDAVDAALRALGFEPAATVEKERDRFRVEGYTVTLDAVAGLGEFVEVEREGPEAAVEDLRAGAFEVLRRLGLDPDDQVRTSYLGLLLERTPRGDEQQ